MARTWRILKWVIGTIAALLLLIVGTASVALIWAYENPLKAWHLTEEHILPKDLKVTWKNVKFDGTRIGGVGFMFDISIDDLHVIKGSPNIDFPIDHLRVRASIFPMERSARVHLVEASAEKDLVMTADPNAPPTPEKSPFQQIQYVLRILEMIHDRSPIEELDAKATRFVYRLSSGADLAMAVQLKQIKDKTTDANFTLYLPGETDLQISAEASLDFAKMKSSRPFLFAKLRFKGTGVDTIQKIELSSDGVKSNLASSGLVLFQKDKLSLRIEPKLSVDFTASEARLQLTGSVDGISGPLKSLTGIRLDLTAPIEANSAWSEKPSLFSLFVPADLFFIDKLQRKNLEAACECSLPRKANIRAKGRVWLDAFVANFKAGHQASPALEADVQIDKIENKVFALALAGKVKMDISTDAKAEKKYLFQPAVDCSFDVSRFLALRPVLEANGILIPAPIDILDGELRFRAEGPVATTERGSQFPLNLEIDLTGKGQVVRGSAYATVDVNSRFTEVHFDVDAKIISLVLDLPPLRPLDGVPRVAADSRFMKTPKVPPKPPRFKLSFNFTIQTTSPDSIRLKSEYFQPYLPLAISIQAANGRDNTGYISLQPFDITYLRRTVHVETLVINLNGDDGSDFPMKGRFRVKQTDYTVFIDVDGGTKSPNITFSSEPYLSKDEIISVLLYDRTANQLEASDAETSGGVQAAIADKAIGLFGLWAFASTPIKSFSYNPVSKVYTATVAVSDDVTAGIGTGWEAATHLELRKRVSKRWSLTAAWTPATQEESAVSKLVLQWEKRF